MLYQYFTLTTSIYILARATTMKVEQVKISLCKIFFYDNSVFAKRLLYYIALLHWNQHSARDSSQSFSYNNTLSLISLSLF